MKAQKANLEREKSELDSQHQNATSMLKAVEKLISLGLSADAEMTDLIAYNADAQSYKVLIFTIDQKRSRLGRGEPTNADALTAAQLVLRNAVQQAKDGLKETDLSLTEAKTLKVRRAIVKLEETKALWKTELEIAEKELAQSESPASVAPPEL